MKAFRSFAVLSAVLAFGLAVIGSWVRIKGAGMTCPDWPLCHGALLPALAGGVVLEWSHRAVALLESVVLLGAIITGWRVRHTIAGVTQTLQALGAIFVVQVLLGGATVHLSNSPASVVLHWGMAMALLATLTILAVLAILAPAPDRFAARERTRAGSPASALASAAGFAFVAMCIGSYVSSSYAGLACTTFPACDGTILGHGQAQLAQMLHRLAAGAFTLAAFMATLSALQTGSARVRMLAVTGSVLVLVQIGLGAANVLLGLPTALREAHAANAALTFIVFVVASVLAAIDPQRQTGASRERTAVPARIAQTS